MAKKTKKPKKPAWQDSTYLKQISYLKKVAADFTAEETRKKADVGNYYGTLATPDQKKAVTRTVTKRVKVPVKTKSGKKKYKYVKKKVKENVYDTKKTFTGQYKDVIKTYKDSRGRVYKRKEKVPVYKTQKVQRYKVTKKGNPATEGLYQRELRESRERDLRDIADDYAARGLIRSGLYAQKRGDYEQEFGKQLAEVNRQKSKQYADIAAERRQFNREQELAMEQARLEAIRRRAARTGELGL